MNDLGLDRSIAEGATTGNGHTEDLERHPNDIPAQVNWTDEERVRKGDIAEYMQPARWWLASTAIPLLAGTFGPMANAFSICSLTQNWSMETSPGGGDVKDIKDPTWALALNGVSLGFALISNLALLMNMGRRASFAVSQPIVVIGWYISSILLICLLAVFKSLMDQRAIANRGLTQAYYYGVIAAAIYFFIASLLIITVYGAYKGHYHPEFKLTTSQRTLMLQTIVFMVYLMGGAAVYSHIENWSYLDAVYWADFTLLTIGIGDFAPATHLGRGLLFPYAMGGILIIGLIIGSIRSLMLEKGKQKMTGRITEKTRRALLKRVLSRDEFSFSLAPEGKEDGGKSEVERRREEFRAMRKVRRLADAEQKWLSLAISLGAWMMLWLLGAVAFWRSERSRGWTYFQALYFSYTSLMTIGYGDIYPVGNYAKPFFVFWSLLAVPTVTIFISNVGDTIVGMVRNVTIYLGELTILPGDKSFKEKLKDLFRYYKKETSLEDNEEEGGSESDQENQEDSRTVERAESVMEQEELREEEEARQKGDIASENIHHYQYLLMHELRKMFRYMNSTPPKQFDYDEWAYYLKLIGDDESVASYHRAPPLEIDGVSSDAPATQDKEKDEGGGKARWSWMGSRSPLMGDKEEAEWLLEALADRLERELKKQRDENQSRRKESGEDQRS